MNVIRKKQNLKFIDYNLTTKMFVFKLMLNVKFMNSRIPRKSFKVLESQQIRECRFYNLYSKRKVKDYLTNLVDN